LINMMHDPQPAVKDTVAWTLGRITDLMFRTIDPQVHLQPLIQAVGTGLQDSGRIAANCCWAIKNLAVGYGPEYTYDGQEQATNALSPYYQALLETLMQTSENRCVGGSFFFVACSVTKLLSLSGQTMKVMPEQQRTRLSPS
jgi:importin subunit beta-1